MRPTLRRGATVGVAALSSAFDADRLERGIRGLEGLGYRVRRATNLGARWRTFAGTDELRLAAFHDLVCDPEVEGVFFARGGHGVLRLMDRIDWELIAARPKVYVGYSDLTPLLLHLAGRLGIVSFHGPLVAGELERGLDPTELDSLRRMLEDDGELRLDCIPGAAAKARGPIEGTLMGGCLTLLTSLLDTAYFPNLDGAVLFLEDVNEPFYRLDRMLTHLRMSGRLDGVKAMILGHLEAVDRPASESFGRTESIARDLESIAPVAWGVAFGHGAPNLTLPLGLTAHLDPERCELRIPGN
ncbi:MAG: LD-carboxypeptidase [Acidobacteriota bacterium]|nr:LD-carboxypeptidase [Acidobacteriota bacterium]